MTKMKNTVAACLMLVLPATGQVVAADYFISPGGSDSADGSKSKPFKTITKARDAARAVKDPVTVFLRGGTYSISEPVVFGQQDGNVTYQAFEGERPVITSALPVVNWKKVDGNLWVADMPQGVKDFKVMFDGGRMLERARSRGFQSPEQVFRKFATRNVAQAKDRVLLRRMEFPDGEIKNWDNLSDVEVFYCGVPWTQNISPIESVDLEKKIAWLAIEGNTPPSTTPKPYNPNYVENVIDVLDQPGEWCVNTKTRKIHYWPVNGEPSDQIMVPRLTEFFRVEGKIDYDGPTDTPVKDLTFRGLTFTQGDRYTWEKDHKGWGIQHDWDKFDYGNALLRFRGAEDCLVDQCRFVNSGNSAIRLDLHSQNITIQNSLIDRVGHMGILLCGYGPGTKDVNKNNTIVNNLIRRVGEVIWHGHAIFVWQSGSNLIANNEIREVPRKAVGLCGVRGAIFQNGKEVDWDEAMKTIRWDELEYQKFSKGQQTQEKILPYLHTRDNIVENNYVYRTRTKIGDGASMNVSGAGTGNVMRRNMLYMVLGNGMRCDDWQNGTVFSENLILSGGIVHKGKNDIINNILVNSTIRFSLYPDQQPNPGSQVKNNLFYYTRDAGDPYTSRSSNAIKTPESCEVENNLYFSTTGSEKLESFLKKQEKSGVEKNSIVADPQFEQPLDLSKLQRPEYYKVKKGSPAFKIGYKQIDVASIGLTDQFPQAFLGEVFPSKRGTLISANAKVSASSHKRGDASKIITTTGDDSTAAVYESKPETSPSVTLELDKVYPIDGLEIVADSKDRQNAMRALTVWSSMDGKEWVEIWRADPFHIAMGRDWMVNPYQVIPAKFIKIGLRPKADLQFTPEDERYKMGGYALRLNRVQVFSQ